MTEIQENPQTLAGILNAIPDGLIKSSQINQNAKWLQFKAQSLSKLAQSDKIITKSKLWKKLSTVEINSRINSPDLPEIIEDNSKINFQKWSGVIEIDPEKTTISLNPELNSSGVIFKDISALFRIEANPLENIADQLLVRMNNRLKALTAAAANHGVILHVPKKMVVEKPFKIIIKNSREYNFFPIIFLIDLDSFSSVKLVIEFVSEKSFGDEIFIPTFFEGSIDEGALMEVVEIQAFDSQVLFFPNECIQIGKNASLNWFAMDKGSQVTQRTLTADHTQTGGEAIITGVYLPGRNQRYLYDTNQNHLASDTTSSLLFKGVLDGAAYSLWKGNILVKKGIQGSDGYQLNNNLLLSSSSHAESIPGLEICTDDVKCSHGVTISDVDKEQLFYLQTRGINESVGKALIVEGFIQAAITRLKSTDLRAYVNEFIGAAEPIFDN